VVFSGNSMVDKKLKAQDEQVDAQKQQELMMKFQMFEQQINQIQQQLQMIEENIGELGNLNLGIEALKGKKGEEILAPIGRGIFVNAKLESEDLTVDVGGKNFVKKNIDDTRELISEQVKKLQDAKAQLEGSLEGINQEMVKLMSDVQK